MIKLWSRLKKVRCRTFCFLIAILFLISVLYHFSNVKEENTLSDIGYPRIIWWTQNFPGDSLQKVTTCGRHKCEFTNDRKYKNFHNTVGFLFYGSDFSHLDLPLPRNPSKIIWGLLHDESPRNTPILSHLPTLELFNYSSTVSRYSHIPLTLQYLEDLEDLLSIEYFLDTNKKNQLLSDLAPVLFIQSDCETSSYRDDYVKELMKYIKVDSYGACLNNKKLPEEFTVDYLNRLYSDDFLKFVNQYKFTIAIENGICEDYVTEKLWRPLKVGSIPIYMGSPSIRDWLPNDRSVIIAQDYESPKHLAAYIEFLNTHDAEYEKYLQHKTNSKITNSKLIHTLKQRTYSFDDHGKVPFHNAFECFVCEKYYETLEKEHIISSVVNQSHYNCLEPIPPMDGITKSWWNSVWHESQKESLVLNRLVMKEKRNNFTEKEFHSLTYVL